MFIGAHPALDPPKSLPTRGLDAAESGRCWLQRVIFEGEFVNTITVIQKDRHLDALPDGWFYNGRNFVSMDGERSDRHPGKLMSLMN